MDVAKRNRLEYVEGMKTLILVNPQAREGKLGAQWAELEASVRGALGTDALTVAHTTPEDHGAVRVREALKGGIERVIVVGGDGTVSEAVNGFFEQGRVIRPGAVLGVLPAGRGDDFFKMLVGRKRAKSAAEVWSQGLEVLKSGRPKSLDVGQISWLSSTDKTVREFINVASFGFPGRVVQRVHGHEGWLGNSRLGKSAWTYLLHSAAALLEYKPMPLKVTVDGNVLYEGPVFSGFILNGQFNGGGMCWDREARIDDGLFHVVVMEPRNPVATLASGNRMFTGDWAGVKGVHRAQGKEVEVLLQPGAPKPQPIFEFDGEQPERPDARGARFKILENAIKIWA